MAHWSRQLTATFGGVRSAAELTTVNIQSLVTNKVVESDELDFKEMTYGSSEKENVDLACDVASLANRSGGLLILGVEEERGVGTAASAPGVPISDAIRRKLESVIIRRVTPFPRYEILAVLDPGVADHGYWVIAVERSANFPHAALVEAGDRVTLRYPVRSGTQTRFLSESEIYRAYRDREQGAAGRQARLDAVWAEGVGALSTDHVWIAAALTPQTPGLLTFTSGFVNGLAASWPMPFPIRDTGLYLSRPSQIRLGRIVADGSKDQASTVAAWIRYSLLDDGSSFFAIEIGRPPPSSGPNHFGVLEEDLSIFIVGALQVIGHLTRDNAGLTGDAYVRCGVRAANGARVELRTGSFSEADTYMRAPFEYAELGIDIDSLAGPCPELVSAAAAIGNAVAQSLGYIELRQFRTDGSINFDIWRTWGPKVRAWATAHDLLPSAQE